ncbi:hypothetical protein C8J57DRAFT_1071901, partial [Mycena rebaudengoi]
VSWGTLGSTLYSPSGRYAIVPFSILIGLIVPVPFWLVHLKFPKLGANHVVTPILCCTRYLHTEYATDHGFRGP